MTTVGYGDKSPKSIPARLFSILWIYIGVIVIGINGASLTAVIIDRLAPQPASMDGRKVGMMPSRIYDANIIAANGGTSVPTTLCLQERNSLFRLLEQLKDGEIDGFLLDKYTYWEWKTMLDKYDRKADNMSTCGEIREYIRKISQNTSNPKRRRLCGPLN